MAYSSWESPTSILFDVRPLYEIEPIPDTAQGDQEPETREPRDPREGKILLFYKKDVITFYIAIK